MQLKNCVNAVQLARHCQKKRAQCSTIRSILEPAVLLCGPHCLWSAATLVASLAYLASVSCLQSFVATTTSRALSLTLACALQALLGSCSAFSPFWMTCYCGSHVS